VRITGWVDADTYKNYLSIANLGIQLRTLSRGETSAAVLDCMSYGLATIVNANGSMADLDAEVVYMLPDEFENQELSLALEELWRDKVMRREIGNAAKDIIKTKHNPQYCAQLYKNSIENFYEKNIFNINKILASLASKLEHVDRQSLLLLSEAIAKTFPKAGLRKTLFVDISALLQQDEDRYKNDTLRNLLKDLLDDPPRGWVIEPVYATETFTYRYARKYITKLLEISNQNFVDEPIDYMQGDVFFGLDICPNIQGLHSSFYQSLRQQGVSVKFMIYSMRRLTHLEYYAENTIISFTKFLKTIVENDEVVCATESVFKEMNTWLNDQAGKKERSYEINYIQQGDELVVNNKFCEQLKQILGLAFK